MKMWVTPDGDKWICDYCQDEFENKIAVEKWRIAFEKDDPILRCSNCGKGDVEIFD